jgi:hypothetical protein
MRLNSKLKAACLTSVALIATLAAGDALAGGRGRGHAGFGGGWQGGNAGGHAFGFNRPANFSHLGGHEGVGYRAGVGNHAYGSTFANERALNSAYHGRFGGGNGDYWGGYYGGGGVYYGDSGYGYGYGGYGDEYASGAPAAYSAATYAPSYYQAPSYEGYDRIYQVPTTVYQPAVRTSYVPVTTYQAQRHIIYIPTTQYRTVHRHCNCQTGY